MAEKLRVRTYNVRFGDAILITVPEGTKRRHVLIDVGNVLSGEGGEDAVFKPVIDDVLKELDGKPLDLYVMTHEHLDHVQGLYYAASKLFAAGELKKRLKVQYAWLTASAAPDYYDTHPDAKKKKLQYRAAYQGITAHLAALPGAESKAFAGLMANNNPRSTEQCVDFLRQLTVDKAHTYYVHRGFKTQGRHPFRDAKFEIWAPEEDSSDYYRSLLPMALAGGEAAPATAAAAVVAPLPPGGVDAGSFYDLVESRANGFADNILAIDKAANNTSVVFAMQWKGWRLLFPGDAELKSWKMMSEQGVLKPVDFLKVSHHGSHNGTPEEEILQHFLPKATASKKRTAVISTWDDTYSGIPHAPTNHKLRDRCSLKSMLDDRQAPYIDTLFAPK